MAGIIEKGTKKRIDDLELWYQKTIDENPMPEGVVWEQGITYMSDGKESHKLDVYYAGESENRPVILDFHGGGLLMGSRGMNRWFCSEMALRGFLVFCIDYPVVPDVDIYGLLRDSYEGIRKAYSLIEAYHGDKNNISIVGDSAGGFIATYLSAALDNPKVARVLQLEPSEIKIQRIGAISALFYSSKVDKNGLFLLRKLFFGEHFRKHPFWDYVNPECEDIAMHLPKIYAVTCEGDFLKRYSRDYCRFLTEKGRPCELLDFTEEKKLEHDFVIMQPKNPRTIEAIEWLSKKLMEHNA